VGVGRATSADQKHEAKKKFKGKPGPKTAPELVASLRKGELTVGGARGKLLEVARGRVDSTASQRRIAKC